MRGPLLETEVVLEDLKEKIQTIVLLVTLDLLIVPVEEPIQYRVGEDRAHGCEMAPSKHQQHILIH